MNPINYETHTFRLENNTTESQEVSEIDFDSLSSVNHRREWDIATEKVFLRLIIDKQFFSKHSDADNFRKAALWDSLHLDFCQHPDVIEYASTSSGQVFAQKFKSVRYIKDKFQKIKADFRKVIMDVRRTGSGGPPPQSRYEHYDDMKHITLGDPSFWTPRVVEAECVSDDTHVGRGVYTLQPDGSSYDISYSGEPGFSRGDQVDQSNGFVSTSAPAPTPPAPPTLPTLQAMTGGQRRRQMDEAVERLLQNSTRISENAEVGLTKILAEFSQMRELVSQTAEDMRRRDLAAAEARHLDRLAWAKIEENTTRARKEIARNDLEMREKEMQLREREMKSRERIAELKLELFNRKNPPQ